MYKCLVVDDNPLCRKITRQMLEDANFEVQDAECVADALALLEDLEFDIVITDIGMPKMDGFQFAKAIRNLEGNDKRTPILAATGYGADLFRGKCVSAGIDAVLSKPFGSEELLPTIDRLIQTRSVGNGVLNE